MSRPRFRACVIAGALAAAALWPAAPASAGGGCHSDQTQGTGDTVAMAMMCFTPSVLRVTPGTEISFVNKDDMPHNISAPWGTDQDLNMGERFTARFDDEGTYPYACTYHYGMTGAIVVGDGTGPATGAIIEPGSLVDTTPVSEQRAASEPATGSGILGWTIAGAIGLLIGAGAMGIARRKPQED